MNPYPDFFCNPRVRLSKPMNLQQPDNHPTSPMKDYELHDVTQTELHKQCELIYDPQTGSSSSSSMKFSGDFESGNLGQVFQIGKYSYEIHLLPDPNEGSTTQWFFFRVDNIDPGEYFFVITGFFRSCNLHYKGSKAAVYSENAAKKGVGWQRIGENLNYFKWKTGKTQEWAFSFNFTVTQRDTMYFAHAYPYTYTDLQNFLKGSLPSYVKVSTITRTYGDIPVPAIFWDADMQKCVDVQSLTRGKEKVAHEPPPIYIESISEFPESVVKILRGWKELQLGVTLPQGVAHNKKPVVVIVARTHPGETNSSYAMEGFLKTLFNNSQLSEKLRQSFSWLIIPMMNPDGVICGFYRPSLSGDDMNRIWQQPDPIKHPTATAILDTLNVLDKERGLQFFLDFHGHTAACNSFVYGFENEENRDLYTAERVFPLLMTKFTPLFSHDMCSFLKQKQYEGTMRVVLRRRFHILFAYTLEMSYGGSDFGPRRRTQFTPHDYRSIGEATVHAINEMLLNPDCCAAKEVMLMLPPPEVDPQTANDVRSKISIVGTADESKPPLFRFSPLDVTIDKPHQVNLVLRQSICSPPKL